MKFEEMITTIETAAKKCTCGNHHNRIPIEMMTIGHDAFEQCASFLSQKNYKHVLFIVDKRTYHAAGEQLKSKLEAVGITCSICYIEPNASGDVVADESAIVQALLEVNANIDALLAVGSGTLHDITRFCSAKTEKPFISIPTAASVDGFTSLGAPLIIKGVKQTFQTVSPIALFADIDVLINAPQEMTAAGFGDMIAKYTSLADWKFGQLIHDEPYCPLVAAITKEALHNCVDKKNEIALGKEEGIQILLASLIQSGLAMLVFGQSHPASGGEHHLSHYWEMEFLQKKRRQVLHGAKVGVSSILLAQLYKEWFEDGSLLPHALKEKEQDVANIIKDIPEFTIIKTYIEEVGGPVLPADLDISAELVQDSLQQAHLLRDRFTMLKCFTININKK